MICSGEKRFLVLTRNTNFETKCEDALFGRERHHHIRPPTTCHENKELRTL